MTDRSPSRAQHPHGLTPERETWLRDPRHPVNNGFRLHPVPNLIVTRSTPHIGERYLRMSLWMRRHIIWVHHTPLQKFLIWTGSAAMLLTFTAVPMLLF